MRSLLRFVFVIVLVSASANAKPVSILILGDSLSASYGMTEQEGWVHLLQQRQPDLRLINASISGETTDGGLRRLPGLLTRHQPDWIFVELGGNDGLRGFPLTLTEQNLEQIVALGLDSGSQVLLSEILLPPNYGRRYTEAFQGIFEQLSDRHQVQLVPFFMRDIAIDPELMQADGIHPNQSAQPLIADTLEPWFLKTLPAQ